MFTVIVVTLIVCATIAGTIVMVVWLLTSAKTAGTSSTVQPANTSHVHGQHTTFDVEVYTENAKVFGCGLSFDASWKSEDSSGTLGAVGSLNFMKFSSDKQLSSLKMGAGIDDKLVAVSSSWAQIPGYGDTKQFEVMPVEKEGTFYAINKIDPSSRIFPSIAAKNGFQLGFHFAALPVDETVDIPAVTDTRVLNKLDVCLSSIN